MSSIGEFGTENKNFTNSTTNNYKNTHQIKHSFKDNVIIDEKYRIIVEDNKPFINNIKSSYRLLRPVAVIKVINTFLVFD